MSTAFCACSGGVGECAVWAAPLQAWIRPGGAGRAPDRPSSCARLEPIQTKARWETPMLLAQKEWRGMELDLAWRCTSLVQTARVGKCSRCYLRRFRTSVAGRGVNCRKDPGKGPLGVPPKGVSWLKTFENTPLGGARKYWKARHGPRLGRRRLTGAFAGLAGSGAGAAIHGEDY